MQVVEITRNFKYNSVDLPDPNPSLGPDDVRQFYASQYPELLNAVVEGPTTKAGVATYSFARAAGAKGAPATTKAPAKVVLERALSGNSDDPHDLLQLATDGRYQRAAQCIAIAASTKPGGAPLRVPTQAFGIFG